MGGGRRQAEGTVREEEEWERYVAAIDAELEEDEAVEREMWAEADGRADIARDTRAGRDEEPRGS